MTELLDALGWRFGRTDSILFVALLGVSTTVALIAAFVVAAALSISLLVVQALIWAIWLIWLGAIFPRTSRRDAERPCEWPYRRAFLREILVGISVAFSQFLRPAVAGIAIDGGLDSGAGALIGVPLLLAGVACIAAGASTLGLARTLFVHEYVPRERRVVKAGIYHFVRHPLFIGGVVVSLGLAFSVGDTLPLELAILNALVLPAYIRLEDRRCYTVLGREYVDYSLAVGGVVSRWRSWITSVAQLHHLAGRIDPRVGRARVKRR
jgi:protein-S-isoprenylcysteine O-methyltransferase Ste14